MLVVSPYSNAQPMNIKALDQSVPQVIAATQINYTLDKLSISQSAGSQTSPQTSHQRQELTNNTFKLDGFNSDTLQKNTPLLSYQFNQDLLKRQEAESILGIDYYA